MYKYLGNFLILIKTINCEFNSYIDNYIMPSSLHDSTLNKNDLHIYEPRLIDINFE